MNEPLFQGYCRICRTAWVGHEEFEDHQECRPVNAGHARLLDVLHPEPRKRRLRTIIGGGESTPGRGKLRRVV